MQSVKEILSELENADNTTKNQIENELVSIGESVVPQLVDQLQVVRGIKRGVVAMTLIRLGDASVTVLLLHHKSILIYRRPARVVGLFLC